MMKENMYTVIDGEAIVAGTFIGHSHFRLCTDDDVNLANMTEEDLLVRSKSALQYMLQYIDHELNRIKEGDL